MKGDSLRAEEVRQHKYHLIFVVAGIAISLIVIGVAGSLLMTMENQLRDDAEQQVRILTEQTASNVSNHLSLTDQAVSAFTLQSSDLDDIQPALENLKESFGFEDVVFINNEGFGCYSDGRPLTSTEGEFGEEIKTSGDVTRWSPHRTEEGKDHYLISKELSIEGESIGMLYVDVSIDALIGEDAISLYQGENFFILFKTSSGVIVTDPSKKDDAAKRRSVSLYESLVSIFNEADGNALSADSVAENEDYAAKFIEAIDSTSSEQFVGTINGETQFICLAPIDLDGSYVCNIVPEESVRSELDSIRTAFEIVFAVILLCLLMLLTMSFFFYRRRTEERDAEMRTHLYGALSNSLDMAVNMYSPDDGVVTPIVAKARVILGYPMIEILINKRIADKIELSEEGRNLLRRIKSGEVPTLETGEFSLIDRHTGERKWVTYSVNPFFYENKRQILNVFRDSTNEKNLQLSMREAMVAAETANNAKSEFLSRMSHEIRTPMNAIIGMTQILQNNLDDHEKVKTSLRKIVIASNHLLSLINDVLDISKIESGKMVLMNEPFLLSELIENVSLVITPQCELKHQTFVVEADQVCGDRFTGDRTRLQQVLINLLTNAVKYTPEQGNILFRVTQKCGTARNYVQTVFVVQDNGIGMSEEYQEHIFEPFVMEERSTAQGTGLGMPIVKNILTMMGGDIQVESALDKGTTFTVMVNLDQLAEGPAQDIEGEHIGEFSPIYGVPYGASMTADEVEPKAGEEGRTAAQEEDEQRSGTGGEKETEEEQPFDFSTVRVLLAEDNELNAEIASELLSDAGVNVEWAEDGSQAVEMFQASEPGYYDIILMDIQMPNMDGYEATGYIRQLDREDAVLIPIVAMSANAFMEDMQASLKSGMNAHLSKPIDIRNVLATIKEYTLKRLP